MTRHTPKMKRKRINNNDDGSYENETPEAINIPNIALRSPEATRVPLSSIYKRLKTGVSTSPAATCIPSLEKTKPNTPKTPSHKRKRMLGK